MTSSVSYIKISSSHTKYGLSKARGSISSSGSRAVVHISEVFTTSLPFIYCDSILFITVLFRPSIECTYIISIDALSSNKHNRHDDLDDWGFFHDDVHGSHAQTMSYLEVHNAAARSHRCPS
jgi:hypothetical protein